MKRKLAILLTFIFLVTFALPVGGFAATMDKALENAIKIAKTKFKIPEDYKFSSSISSENKKNIFNLNWVSKDTMAPASINVRIDESGTVVGYNRYSQADYVQTKKLPKFGRQEAKSKADAYIKWIEPGLTGKIVFEENNQNIGMDTSYYLSYHRVVNGVPFYNDRVTLNINRETGELQDYMRQWTDGVTFPAATGAISVDNAQKAYEKNMGLRMIYKYTNTDDALKAYAVYAPIYDNGSYAINALTGERQRIFNNYYYGGYGDSAVFTMNSKAKGTAQQEIQLSPDELKAVQNASKLMSKDEAEKIARNSKFLSLAAETKLQSYYLNENWPSKEDYVWSLQFNKPAGDKNKYDEFTSVAVNAKTGEILSFYRGGQPLDAVKKTKGDMAAAKTEADAFLKEYYPQYYRQTEYDAIVSENSNNGTDTFYSFKYNRMVNGTLFPDNGINVSYDNVSGTITGFNLTWFNIAFPSVDKAIGVPAATGKLFQSVGLGMEYKFEFTGNTDAAKLGYPAENSKVVLVYALSPNKPYWIDAITGTLLNADGMPYKDAARVNYTDIKGSPAEKQIMVLADNGISLAGTEFRPNSAITQQDFLTLLSKTLNYYGPVITPSSSSKEIDDLYAFLQREGIVKAGEKAPSSTVTKEEGIKFLIRALKYDKVAEIKGIFNISFRDKAGISPNLAGYVAIAAGLGIVDPKSAYLKPKDKLTRADSAILIYNYLQS